MSLSPVDRHLSSFRKGYYRQKTRSPRGRCGLRRNNEQRKRQLRAWVRLRSPEGALREVGPAAGLGLDVEPEDGRNFLGRGLASCDQRRQGFPEAESAPGEDWKHGLSVPDSVGGAAQGVRGRTRRTLCCGEMLSNSIAAARGLRGRQTPRMSGFNK